jgi:hypothetical protein
LTSTLKFLPVGRYATLLASVIYISGWATIDFFGRDFLLKPQATLSQDKVMASWDSLMSSTKVFTDSALMSPDLDYGYLQLIDVVHRQEALTFLTKNGQQLKDAEQKYSSIDEAYKKLVTEPPLPNEKN